MSNPNAVIAVFFHLILGASEHGDLFEGKQQHNT
jgi:hypothetical protein